MDLMERSTPNTTDQLWGGWAKTLRRRHLSASTIRSRRQMVASLVPYLEHHGIDPWAPTTEHLECWLDEKDASAATRAFWASHLTAFYGWVSESTNRDNPARHLVRPKVPRGIPRPITEDDLSTLLDSCHGRVRAWVVLAAYGGLRCKEIAGLERRDILERQAPACIMVMTGKGGKQRAVPMHPEVWTALNQHGLPSAGPLFTKNNGDIITPDLVSKYGNDALRDHGVDCTMHQLRHRFGTMINRNAGVRTAQELLGHASLSTTAIYTQVDTSSKLSAVASL